MNTNKLLNPNAFREFKFRKWRMANFAHAGMWDSEYQKMNWLQKLIFNVSGFISEQFRPKFQFYLEENTGLKDQNGQEIWTNRQIHLKD